MSIRTGLVITVKHYSLLNVFKSIAIHVEDNTVVARLPKEAQKAAFIKEDPLVVAFEAAESVEIIGARLINIDLRNEQITFVLDEPDEGIRSRSYERYPVSLYADFKLAEGGKKYFALVKDLSEYGMMIYSKDSFHNGQKLNLDIFLTRDIMSLTAEITRKVEHDDFIEYGLSIRHNGPAVYNHIKSFVKKSQDEHAFKFNKE